MTGFYTKYTSFWGLALDLVLDLVLELVLEHAWTSLDLALGLVQTGLRLVLRLASKNPKPQITRF